MGPDYKPPVMYACCANYGGTGEGMTISIVIMRCHPDTAEEVILEKFTEKFGGFLAGGAEIMPASELDGIYAMLIPHQVAKTIEKNDAPGFFFATEYYINYS